MSQSSRTVRTIRRWYNHSTRDKMARNEQVRAISPVARLVDDVLLVIFHHVAKDHQYTGDTRCKTKIMSPLSKIYLKAGTSWLSFTQVCRRWRHVALCDPRLWNIITLDENGSSRMLARFLELSQNQPLDVSIVGPTFRGSESIRAFMRLLRPLRFYLSRVHELTYLELTQSEVLSLCLSPLPALRDLNVVIKEHVSESTSCTGFPINLLFSDSLPHLHRICGSGTTLRDHSNLRLEGLTGLHLYQHHLASAADFITTLRCCTNLRSLQFSLPYHCTLWACSGPITTSSTIRLPLLEDLGLEGHYIIIVPLLALLLPNRPRSCEAHIWLRSIPHPAKKNWGTMADRPLQKIHLHSPNVAYTFDLHTQSHGAFKISTREPRHSVTWIWNLDLYPSNSRKHIIPPQIFGMIDLSSVRKYYIHERGLTPHETSWSTIMTSMVPRGYVSTRGRTTRFPTNGR